MTRHPPCQLSTITFLREIGPPPPHLHAATESANVISLAAENEPALMRYAMDGSPWSFISPFLDLCDTFQHENFGHLLELAEKYPCGELLLFLLPNEPGHSVGGKRTGGWFDLVVTVTCCVVIKTLSQDGASLRMVDLGVWLD